MPDQTEKHPRGIVKASGKQVWKRGYRSKGPSTSMKVRTNVVVQTVVLLAAVGLIVNLAHIMIFQHDKYGSTGSDNIIYVHRYFAVKMHVLLNLK